ncbi:hydantase: amidase, hydantoinase/carbamoylase family [Gaiella occulta]|uniref:Hydantase: amidase, hydantoinase/carbamoylase family n=1 Tax=Gaiella occulta TaxID=1002870 RepID=A0A7M2Z0W8_9ACTN|nr:M20 family metallo-hydrolase [Gaiella occulta]RDI75665.1 hydantase: amidase, hydantoinase/carbamoylase family [Gaiella occulta]
MRATTTDRSSEEPRGSVAASLDELAEIGRDINGGVTRIAWSPELFEAYAWVRDRLEALGIPVEIDAAGNLLARWEVGTGLPVLVGSHLDTVPTGGRFDGVLGVVAAVHAVELLKGEGFEPGRPLWIAAFMDEEGTRFNTALFGSRAFAGGDVRELGDRVDASGTTLREAMAAAGFDLERVGDARRVGRVGAYLELHVEQGRVLEAEGRDIGVVTSIVGLRGYRVRLLGEANHAGTTPMQLRRDAFVGAARIALELRDQARARKDVTTNVGKIAVAPGGANVVPGLADFTIDARAATPESMADVERLVRETVARVATEESLEFDLQQTFSLEPLELDPRLADAVEHAAIIEGARTMRMSSGAGHDAMVVGRHVPAAMFFVPSRGGISHSPDEFSDPSHVDLGMRVLATALRDFLRAE